MAEDQVGVRKNHLHELAPWTKLFSAFKVALGPKKLFLAAAGIFVMSGLWWLLAVIFSINRSEPPLWREYKVGKENLTEAYKDFKVDRRRWNLYYALAGKPLPDRPTPAELEMVRPDVADVADTLEEYNAIKAYYEEFQVLNTIRSAPLKIKTSEVDKKPYFEIDLYKLPIEANKPKVIERTVHLPFETENENLRKAKDLKLENFEIKIPPDPKAPIQATVDGKPVTIDPKHRSQAEEVASYIHKGRTMAQIKEQYIQEEKEQSKREYKTKALALLSNDKSDHPKVKPAGKFRVWPWFENRGPNQFLLITGKEEYRSADGTLHHVPWEKGEFFSWFLTDEVPVLIEPLVKFLGPVLYLLHPGAGGWPNRLYLILLILSTLLTWAIFGGAITRMAAVEVARPNDKIGMTEALRFAWARLRSYFAAPLIPLAIVLGLIFLCVIFAWIQIFTFQLGDLLVFILFPLVLILGLVMACFLVGLIGWPMMYATISAEGSDTFDGFTRSYSYVYQAPWHYLWYGFLSLVYGAVLIFFVGLMGSLTVYMGKFGLSQAPSPSAWKREPTYLFIYAPTSYGWRDLLLEGSPDVQKEQVLLPTGVWDTQNRPSDNYRAELTWINKFAAGLASFWLYLIFLMVIGFGYSFFWCASTIIYLLMRKRVDDTELDEIHLEEDELEEPYPAPAAPSAPAKPPAPPAPGNFIPSTDLGVRQTTLPAPATPAEPVPPPSPPEPEPPKPRAVVTQLAPPDKEMGSEPPAAPSEPPASSSAPVSEGTPAPASSTTEHKDGDQSPPGGTT
jgi:hypothetical protein